MKHFFLFIAAVFCTCFCTAQNASDTLTFAYISDTHVGSGTGADDLEKCVADMVTLPQIQFVIHAGDVTEFGADTELALAKSIMDRLRVPYYIVPGNHDVKWSESGAIRSTACGENPSSPSMPAESVLSGPIPGRICAWVWLRSPAKVWYGSIRW